MQFIAPDVVVLDPWAAVAAEYCDHAPRRRDFSLPLPYQTTQKDADSIISTAAGASDAPASPGGESGGSAAAAVGGSLAAPQSADASGSKQKKRKQSGSYQPNVRELEAAARHATVAPQLTAAAATVQQWLHASSATAVQQALCGAKSTPGSRQEEAGSAAKGQPEQAAALEAAAGAAGAPAAEASTARGIAAVAAAREAAADASAAEPDFRAMFELRYTLRPKLQFATEAAGVAAAGGAGAATAAVGAAAGAAAAGVAREHDATGRAGSSVGQDVQQPAAVNLFNRLVSSEDAPNQLGSSSSSDGVRSRGRVRERLAWAGGYPVLLPLRSRFLMSDARQLAPLVDDAQAAGGYHCIVMDAPWENASAKRSARYPTLPSRNLLGLPLRQLMCQSGCLVAMWITNRERHRRFIDSELLPGWGLRHLATWHWLKITDRGQLVSRLDIEHRRPYESLLLCWPSHLPPPPGLPASGQQQHSSCANDQAAAAGGQAAGHTAAAGQADASSKKSALDASASGFHLLQGRPLVVAAVPPAAHSRKPHLGPLLLPLLPPGARCLEMFARELHSGWTSWGNEALKFQSIGCFEPVQGAG